MNDYLLEEIPYDSDSSLLFDRFADEPWSVFLDSNQPNSVQGRFDIISSRPNVRITSHNRINKIDSYSENLFIPGDPFSILKDYLSLPADDTNKIDGLPFVGGAIGYFSYDLGRSIERIPSVTVNDLQLPDMKIGIYPWAIVVDHAKKKTILVGDKTDLRVRREWDDLVKFILDKSSSKNHRGDFKVLCEVSSEYDRILLCECF